jgi:hypothetical protein
MREMARDEGKGEVGKRRKVYLRKCCQIVGYIGSIISILSR